MSRPEPDGGGIRFALAAKGAQDKYMAEGAELFDCRKQLLTGPYQVGYERLPLIASCWDALSVRLYIKRSCDLINMLDVVIDNPNAAPLNTLLRRIDVEYGAGRIDSLSVGDDLETQIETNCAIFRRAGVSHAGGRTFVPLVAAPFHEHNLVTPSSKHNELVVVLRFKEAGAYLADRQDSVVLYGNMHFLDTPQRRRLVDPFELLTIQNQYTGGEPVKRGVNTIRLNFNHPLCMLYFWGPDKSEIKHIDVRFDKSSSFYSGPLEPLERAKAVRGLSHVRPTCVFFSNTLDFAEPTQCTVNFSRIDYADLIIETDEEDPPPVHVVGLCVQPLRCINGLVGLVFSK